MRRVVIVPAGILLGFFAGLVALAVLGAVALTTLPPAASLDLVTIAAWSGTAVTAGAGAALWSALLLCGFLPVAVCAVLGEAAGWRGPLWYAGATGALAAGSPWLAGPRLAGPEGATMAGRVALPLFLAGVLAGFVYWVFAGRSAGDR